MSKKDWVDDPVTNSGFLKTRIHVAGAADMDGLPAPGTDAFQAGIVAADENARINEKVLKMMSALRVVDPGGDTTKKISWKEFLVIREDPEFIPVSRYMQDLFYYSDGVTPRPKPIRALVQNEVGMYRNQIYYLRDAGPDDYGESSYVTVPADAPVEDKSGGSSEGS